LTLIFGSSARLGAGILGGGLGVGAILYLIIIYSIIAAIGGTIGEMINI
jgi:hypothetical protein